MRKEFNRFVEPGMGRPLKLKIYKMHGEHVISGKLYNNNVEFPIIRGIPRFVDTSFYKLVRNNSKVAQTLSSFGTKWNERRYQRLGHIMQDTVMLKELFMASLGCKSQAQLKNILKVAKRTLNAGCGVAWSEYLFNYNSSTERHCIDMSLSVEAAYKRTKNFSNIIVSQASIFELPYPDGYFDIIYSLGVIHHVPEPGKAFIMLVKKLAPKGLIGIYIYNKKPFLREIADTEIRRITNKMDYDKCMEFSKAMTQLGKSLYQIDQPVFIKRDIDLLGIKKGKYRLQRLIYDYFIKCWYNPKQDVRFADLVNQDWYHPYYASHHTKEEILDWFKKEKISNIVCIQPKGWEYSGYFISGRKK